MHRKSFRPMYIKSMTYASTRPFYPKMRIKGTENQKINQIYKLERLFKTLIFNAGKKRRIFYLFAWIKNINYKNNISQLFLL